jgi:circadian clock protein KaiC
MTSTIDQSPGPAHTGPAVLPKCPTGIQGLDEITAGGLPQGRPTLVCGGAGCGKTLLGAEFLVRGATIYSEPGVMMVFEERADELAANVASMGFDLKDLISRGLLVVDHVHIERSEIHETGEYDLEGLFIRLGHAIDSIGAKRVVLDTLESLFGGLSDTAILRAELRRLFRWLKDKGVTAVITGERGAEGQLTRQGLEEYVSDCVIILDHRVIGQVSTRRLRVVKYRGSKHGTNEYPFLIDDTGISVLPVTSVGLAHIGSDRRVTTGLAGLDDMLDGRGYFRGSTVMVSGTPGTGKTSVAAYFARATCQAGERCLYFAFEESEGQLVRNMQSIGLDLRPHIQSGLLRVAASRPTLFGLEMHLAVMHKLVGEFKPAAVVVDPITSLMSAGGGPDVLALVLRLVDFLKGEGITALFTSLVHFGATGDAPDLLISSLIDTWISVRDFEDQGQRTRGVSVLKSRGMAHSNRVRAFVMSERGIDLRRPALALTAVPAPLMDERSERGRRGKSPRSRRAAAPIRNGRTPGKGGPKRARRSL